MKMIASMLHLRRRDQKMLRLTDTYSLHRVVYSLFEDTRSLSEKSSSEASGILFADLGGSFQERRVLILSNRLPAKAVPMPDGEAAAEGSPSPGWGRMESKPVPEDFLEHNEYQFQVTVNPTRRDSVSRKLIPVRGRNAVTEWFNGRMEKNWGFHASARHLVVQRIQVLQFKDKKSRPVTLSQALIQGKLRVTDRNLFEQAFIRGIGRGRTFGCGLLQLVPLNGITHQQGDEK